MIISVVNVIRAEYKVCVCGCNIFVFGVRNNLLCFGVVYKFVEYLH